MQFGGDALFRNAAFDQGPVHGGSQERLAGSGWEWCEGLEGGSFSSGIAGLKCGPEGD